MAIGRAFGRDCCLRRKVNMKNIPKQFEPPQFLSGWKEIANYLGKGVRTVQRYEREMGLPVRRPAGKPRASVLATRAEIDAWVSASPYREVFQLARVASRPDLSCAHKVAAGIQEMTRLREQMFDLRNDLRRSLNLLCESLQQLRLDVASSGSYGSPSIERAVDSWERMAGRMRGQSLERKAS